QPSLSAPLRGKQLGKPIQNALDRPMPLIDKWARTLAKSPSALAQQRAVGYPSGQRGQTVNLLAYAYAGSNPAPTTTRFPSLLCTNLPLRGRSSSEGRVPIGPHLERSWGLVELVPPGGRRLPEKRTNVFADPLLHCDVESGFGGHFEDLADGM